jgi:hypothetical protein
MSPFVKKYKVIPHPGEVNKIREVPDMPHVVVTHTDAPEVRTSTYTFHRLLPERESERLFVCARVEPVLTPMCVIRTAVCLERGTSPGGGCARR